DLSTGRLQIGLVLAGTAAEDPEVTRATEAALPHWRALYASMGIDLEFSWWEYPEGNLRAPGVGSSEHYRAISESTPVRSVNVVIVPELRGSGDIYGMSG